MIVNKKCQQPITLEITLESEEELCDLWHRMNIGKANVTNEYLSKGQLKYSIDGHNDNYTLWDLLDKEVERRDLKNED